MLSVKLDINSKKLMKNFGLEEGGIAQQTTDNLVLDYSYPYCPMDSGVLAKSGYIATRIGSGMVVWPGPYAHYMYHGVIYGPNIPIFDDNSGEPSGFFSPPGEKKSPTGRRMKYNKSINPLAGSFWFIRMKADHLRDIIREVRKVVRSKQR